MEKEHNEGVRRVTRQSWKPSKPVLVLQGSWKVAYSVIKIILAALATVLAITAICLFAFVTLLADYLQSPAIMDNTEVVIGDFDQTGNSVMYYRDSDGQIQVLQRLHADTDKDWAFYDEIPEELIYAAVAIEDHRFFEHQGVDWIPTIKACVSMFVGGREFGGSSITQQLIKNLYLEYDESADDVTVQRKLLEIFRATEFEKRYDKKFIMEWYLNKIYLGERCKGVKPAAAEYFGKELEDLNAAECAALISITNNPSLFNPYRTGLDNYKDEQLTGMERNKRRREDTLYMMREYGWLTDEEYQQALIDSENLTLKRGIDEEDRNADCINEDCGYHGKVGTFIKDEEGNFYCPVCNQPTKVGSDASQEVYSWFADVVLEEVAQRFCEDAGINWTTASQDTRNDFKRLVCQSGLHIYTTLDMTVQNQVDKIYTDLSQIPTADSIQQLQSGIVVIDNKTGDIATWNRALLKKEMKKLSKVDMSRFGFDKERFKYGKDRIKHYGEERLRTDRYYNLELVNIMNCEGKEGYPVLEAVDAAPDDLIPFNFCKSATDFDCGVHFCIDDYQFERVWNKPQDYLELLGRFQCVVTPDFSVYRDMPIPMKKWNIYRSRALGNWWQRQGLNVVPNVTWSGPDSMDYCLDGIPKHSTIFISTVGVAKDKETRERVCTSMKKAMKLVEPSRVLYYGSDIGFNFGKTEVLRYKTRSFRSNDG